MKGVGDDHRDGDRGTILAAGPAPSLRPGTGRVKLAAMTENDDPAAINRRLETLRLEHRDLDAAIDRLSALGSLEAHDDLTLKRLKKRKLWLKDCIARLQSDLIPDEPA